MGQGKRVRVGVVRYLLGLPLVYGLARRTSEVELVRETPARIAELLLAGELDVGLAPVVALFERRELCVVPGLCVACDGAVGSIRLFHKCPLGSVRRVALDESSRTSALLARVLLERKWGARPEYVTMAPDLPQMLQRCDAALLIGDPALAAVSLDPWVDLGEAWKELTGLPFVFAVWAARSAALPPGLAALLRQSYEQGRRAVEEIAREEAGRRGMHLADAVRYLTHNVRYELDERAIAGLARFAQIVGELGLVDTSGWKLTFAR